MPETSVTPAVRTCVEELVYGVARAIDDDDLEHFPDHFTDDAVYKVASRFNVERGLPHAPLLCVGRAMIVDRITSLRRANIYPEHRYRHLVSGIHILPTSSPESFEVRSSYLVVRIMANGDSAIYSSGEYRDVVTIQGGVARFTDRTVVFDSKHIDTLLVIPL